MATTILRENRPKITGVLFDMDGVILDTEKLYTRFWQEAAISLGYPMTYEQALGMRSLNREYGAAKLHSYFGPEVDYIQVRDRRIELMDPYVEEHGVDLLPGVFELLDALDARGIPAAIATSSPIHRVESYLGPKGLLPRFQKIITGYDVAQGKPAPDIYLAAAKALGQPPETCLAVEDSHSGILSAYRAGTQPVMVPDQDPPTEETMGRLYALCNHLPDIISLLD